MPTSVLRHHRMLISSQGEYAVRVLLDLARAAAAEPLTGAQLARRQRIPVRALGRILAELERAGLVRGKPGRGLRLGRRPEEISLGEILASAEGPLEIVACHRRMQAHCRRLETCMTRKIWERVDRDFNAALAGISLCEMLRLEAEQSVWGDAKVLAGLPGARKKRQGRTRP
jgi:Rrf2 family protein